MKKQITLSSCEITGEVTLKWISDKKCIHTFKASSQQTAKNQIKKYRISGVMPSEQNRPLKLIATVERSESILAPVNYQYFHKRCQKPVFIESMESVIWNGKKEIILILKDAAGKIYRIFQSLIDRYLSDYLIPQTV